ncbi:MAG: group III truncated hemoglobin [Bacteroidia bacterium]|jgi:hemoglobin|nr:group III truncated hemoglobin [Bacteroidia bacterium]
MKKDIEDRKDIELLINSFYDKVKQDAIIGSFFTEVVQVNWEKHLPVMYNFWENIVFQTGSYNGNPMDKHLELNKKSLITMEHFQRWILLFNETVDELFKGEKAELIKQRALSISTVMQIKILQS